MLLITGGLLLLFALSAYGWMSVEQHKLSAQWQEQNVRTATTSTGMTDPPVTENGVTLLTIPRIGLEAAILEGTDRKTLLLAPGHLKETAEPGESGNSVVAGHRDTFFRHVYELNPGDDILVRRAGLQYHYVVTSKAIVSPFDVSVIRPTEDAQLTLITCYPTYYIGPAPQRAVVVARLQNAAGSGRSAAIIR